MSTKQNTSVSSNASQFIADISALCGEPLSKQECNFIKKYFSSWKLRFNPLPLSWGDIHCNEQYTVFQDGQECSQKSQLHRKSHILIINRRSHKVSVFISNASHTS